MECETSSSAYPPSVAPVIEEDQLIDDLASIICACGAQRFVASPILQLTEACFPDRWAPNTKGVEVVAERLMRYAGLRDLKPDITIYADDEWEKTLRSRGDFWHQGAAAMFFGIEDARAVFGCELSNLADANTLIGAMGHEVAHVFREVHGLTVDDHAREEILTDVTSVYLGFGVFACNCSRVYRKTGELRGALAVTRESTRRLGYLPPPALCFLLAAQVAARGLSRRQQKSIQRSLEPAQKAYFADALADLSRNRVELLAALGIEQELPEAVGQVLAPTSAPELIESPRLAESDPVVERLVANRSRPHCPSCGSEISSNARECPQCHEEFGTDLPWPTAVVWAILGILFALWLTWPQ